MYSRHRQDAVKMYHQVKPLLVNTSLRRVQDVFKRYSTGLRDVLRRRLSTEIFADSTSGKFIVKVQILQK